MPSGTRGTRWKSILNGRMAGHSLASPRSCSIGPLKLWTSSRARSALAPETVSEGVARSESSIALSDLGRTRECIELLERDLPSNPNWNAHLGYATALLAENRQLDGWAQFEFRWLTGPLAENRPEYGKPVWMGQDLRGKTIYVRAEQGFGDVFQMLRYLPLLQDRGARVLLQPIEEFTSMYRQLEGVDAIVDAGAPLPPFDYWTNLMSLPWAFGTTEATIPRNVPYLTANPEIVARWRPAVPHDGKLNVGIVWSGNPKQRYNGRRSLSIREAPSRPAGSGRALLLAAKGTGKRRGATSIPRHGCRRTRAGDVELRRYRRGIEPA